MDFVTGVPCWDHYPVVNQSWKMAGYQKYPALTGLVLNLSKGC